MSDTTRSSGSFLDQLIEVIKAHMSNDQFGVSELADEMHMSRSNLLRKVKKESDLSVSQLINQVRLNRAMELLRGKDLNVSQVAHEVGFNSTSYFIKCFREHYGYPPGEALEHLEDPPASTIPSDRSLTNREIPSRSRRWLVAATIVLALLAIVVVAREWWPSPPTEEKSIAVLPFKNDSNDSTNLYLINGLMESTLTKLQQIRNLRVVSRTSVEKYRHSPMSIPEMAKALDVKYFVDGSGQKMGDHILLNIRLIDARTDKHLWARQYRRDVKDIFDLQEEIARNITEEIEVIITPEEQTILEKKPTEDLMAYDYFLKGKEHFFLSSREHLEESVVWFNKAIERDPEFSLAYASAAMVYYYLDFFQAEKKHGAEVENFAEKAILYDAKSSESMIAKALSFAVKGRYDLSVSYFEKALEYNPQSGLALHFLTEFYNIYVPHPPKYLEYAIAKVKVDRGADSATAGFNYFHLSNALVQNGFVDEALHFSNKSLALDSNNFFAGLVNDYIRFAKDRDCKKAAERLTARWARDTTRFDILQEVGKMYAMDGDYGKAARCYDRSLAMMEMFGLDVFKHEYLRIAATYRKTGQLQKAEEFSARFKDFAEKDLTIYKDIYLASYHEYHGDKEKAIALMNKFADEQDNFIYWLLLMRDSPMDTDLHKTKEFDRAMKKIEKKFWAKHEELKDKWEDEWVEL